MNKFMKVFALIAVAAIAGCSAQEENEVETSQVPQVSGQKEIGLLLGHEKLFAQYCLDERAAIIADVKSRTNMETSRVFNIFFGAATEIADEVLVANKQAVAEFAKEIENPGQEVSQEPLSEDQVAALIAQGRQEIQSKGSVLGRVTAAAKSLVASVMFNTANSAIFIRLAQARSYMSADTLKQGIEATCAQVAEYNSRLEADLESVKGELKAQNSDDAETQKFVENMKLPALNCYTTKFISRLHAFCELVKNGAAYFFKMLGVQQTFFKPPTSKLN